MGASNDIPGSANATIAAHVTGPTAGTKAQAGDVDGALTSIVNDLATVRDTALCPVNGFAMSGACTIGSTLVTTGLITGHAGARFDGAVVQALDGANVSGADLVLGEALAAPVTIATATNTTPIVLGFSSPVNVSVGDLVSVAGCLGNTNANGSWIASAVSGGTSVTLLGSAGNGAYTANSGTLDKQAQPRYPSARTDTWLCDSFYGTGTQPSGDYWQFSPNGYWIAHSAAPTASAQYMGSDMRPPNGSALTAVTVYFQPPSGHVGAPVTAANIQVLRLDKRLPTLPTPTNLGFANATYGSAGAYEVYTALTVTLGSPERVDRSRYRYITTFQTETGTNALSGMIFVGFDYTFAALAPEQF